VWHFAMTLVGITLLQFVVQLNDTGVTLHRAVTYCLPDTAMVCWSLNGRCCMFLRHQPLSGFGIRHNWPPACCVLYSSVSQPPGRGPVPGPGINYTGPREFVNLVF
jgi:hypothetical protein